MKHKAEMKNRIFKDGHAVFKGVCLGEYHENDIWAQL